MKKILILSALMTALTSAGAMAADANINFTGTVSAATCTLAAADAAKTLTIPSVSAATLLAAGGGAVTTYYASSNFNFSACPAGLTKVLANYTYQGALTNGTNKTAVSTGTATNVALSVMPLTVPVASGIIAVDGSTSYATTISSNMAVVPVSVGISALNSSGALTLPTVGNYTGTYTVAFTYS